MTRLIIPVLLLTLVVAQPSPAAAGFAAAGFYEGEAAYKRGDFATALRELSPLANLGYAGAQYRLGVMYEKGARGSPGLQDCGEVVQTCCRTGGCPCPTKSGCDVRTRTRCRTR